MGLSVSNVVILYNHVSEGYHEYKIKVLVQKLKNSQPLKKNYYFNMKFFFVMLFIIFYSDI